MIFECFCNRLKTRLNNDRVSGCKEGRKEMFYLTTHSKKVLEIHENTKIGLPDINKEVLHGRRHRNKHVDTGVAVT